MSDRSLLDRMRSDRERAARERSAVDRSAPHRSTGDRSAPGGVGPLGVLPPGIADPAVAGVALVTGAYLAVFLGATDVVGGTIRTAVAVATAGVAGAALARVVRERTAVRLTAALFAATLAGYYFAIPASQRAVFSVESVAYDVVSLLTGLSVLRLALADVWILAVAPVPTFLVGYLAGRGRHVPAATVAGGTLSFLVLTGDAGGTATLAGVVGIALTAGLDTLSAPGRLRSHGGTLAAVLAAMILVSATVTVLPAGAAQPWALDRGNPTLESTLGADDRVEIVGPTRLSPEVRYTIESPIASNWHANAYDRYTGDGWVRSGEQSALDGPLDGPPGETTTANVTIEPASETRLLPAPWQAVDARGAGSSTARVDERETIRLGAPLVPGDVATVESRVLDAEPAELRNASTEYDPAIEARYTQLPESTPDRVGDRTDAIVSEAGAENPYDQAVAIERYLIEEYDYSLTVEKPDGDVADAFLFEMDAGYCTYFATTMVAMLRSQGVPAQFVTGYTTGEAVGDDRYVVRGQNAHAWVKVYFPEHGWVEFDPTPAADRDRIRQAQLAEARADGDENVDTAESSVDTSLEFEGSSADVDPSADDGPTAETNATDDGNDTAAGDGGNDTAGAAGGEVPRRELVPGTGVDGGGIGDGDDGSGGDGWLPVPSGTAAAVWLLLAAAVAAGARRVRAVARARTAARLWLPSRAAPSEDARRAFATLERLLAGRYRPRRSGETPRQYLEAVRVRGADERVQAVGEIYERATYAGTVTRSEAAEARRIVRRLTLERLPGVGRLFGGR
ncbi:transglutaminase-like enzyme, cysteine protease [Halorubrum aidingense JCM 13560]|uniref:Transglutaminase-like enzyme, cysteine protease n=1 Tax=Halorubrum aidingense JCM 13560 TaxID=1230454 RepID=M0PCI5_9EURY|nr:transglutaminase domain-containing protein [Halorubrum aidingense]EMA67756.1 transglutaminase-like enzyme, cysteine protease [Halorubrum aidingense JCM 13560]